MNGLTFNKIESGEKYNDFIIKNKGSFIQAPFYGSWHENLGKSVCRFSVEEDGKVLAYVQAIEVSLPFGQKYFYAPYGPVLNIDDTEKVLPFLKEGLTKLLKDRNGIFFRLDFNPTLDDGVLKKYFNKASRATYKGSYFQPRAEWILDLTKPIEKITKEFHQKTRYSIRLAERKNSEIEIISENFKEYFDVFVKLMNATSKRNGFTLHPEEYYKEVFKSIEEKKNGFLTISKIDREVVGVFLFITYGKEAMYLYGASGDSYRKVPYSHKAQFESIKHAKSLGLEKYNFGGISSNENKVPSLKKLTLYKKRFGGETLNHSSFFDIVNKKIWYKLFVLRKMMK
ncbi:MAG: peptidoglycan pentaglycine glycine transferase (the first glycine) [Candidatus Paceibacteria bacterium]|jgi:peptidoglycan pentaglycine glycine transferase (the first glycine)